MVKSGKTHSQNARNHSSKSCSKKVNFALAVQSLPKNGDFQSNQMEFLLNQKDFSGLPSFASKQEQNITQRRARHIKQCLRVPLNSQEQSPKQNKQHIFKTSTKSFKPSFQTSKMCRNKVMLKNSTEQVINKVILKTKMGKSFGELKKPLKETLDSKQKM